jgi:hypothetical protein
MGVYEIPVWCRQLSLSPSASGGGAVMCLPPPPREAAPASELDLLCRVKRRAYALRGLGLATGGGLRCVSPMHVQPLERHSKVQNTWSVTPFPAPGWRTRLLDLCSP